MSNYLIISKDNWDGGEEIIDSCLTKQRAFNYIDNREYPEDYYVAIKITRKS